MTDASLAHSVNSISNIPSLKSLTLNLPSPSGTNDFDSDTGLPLSCHLLTDLVLKGPMPNNHGEGETYKGNTNGNADAIQLDA